MRGTRKKKTPVTLTEKHHLSANGSSKPHTTRTLIRRFHVLLKKQRQLQKNASSASNAEELRGVEQEIDQLGGLVTYQQMSSIGCRPGRWKRKGPDQVARRYGLVEERWQGVAEVRRSSLGAHESPCHWRIP